MSREQTSEDQLELSISRFIDAPPAKVWQILTERLGEFWCPKPWRAEIRVQEWCAGGRSSMVMHGPDGEAFPSEGVNLEVVPNQRWVFTDAFAHGWQPQGPFMVGIVELEPEKNGTRYVARARHWTAEALEQHMEMGFEQGWATVADQLAELAEAR